MRKRRSRCSTGFCVSSPANHQLILHLTVADGHTGVLPIISVIDPRPKPSCAAAFAPFLSARADANGFSSAAHGIRERATVMETLLAQPWFYLSSQIVARSWLT